MKYYRATTLTKYEALWTITKGVMADFKTKVTSFQPPPGINGRFSFHSFLYLPPAQRLDFVDLHFTFLFTHVGSPATTIGGAAQKKTQCYYHYLI